MYLEVINIIDNPDGSANLELEYDKKLETFIKKFYNRKRFSKKLLQKFVIEGLQNYLNKEDKNDSKRNK